MTWLFDSEHSLSMLSMSSFSFDANGNGVIGSLLIALGFFLFPPLGLFLFVQPMLPGLHHIFKLATHIHRNLDHSHFLSTSCVQLLPMNIGLLCSSPTNILLGVINKSYSFDLLVHLTTNCPLEHVAICS
jgi:hypothetical protein